MTQNNQKLQRVTMMMMALDDIKCGHLFVGAFGIVQSRSQSYFMVSLFKLICKCHEKNKIGKLKITLS